MPYYLITKSEYDTNHSTSLTHPPAWNLSGSECVIHVNSTYTVSNYIETWSTSGDFKIWRNDEDNWRDWETEAFRNGTDLNDF